MIPHKAIEEAVKAFMLHGTLIPALEAAAPHLKADAWDEGEAAGQDNADANRGYNIEHKYNPYRRLG